MAVDTFALAKLTWWREILHRNGLMTKTSELREMSDDQLTHELRQTQQELFRLHFQAATERLDAPSNLRRLRQTIARIKTIQTERVKAGSAGEAS